MHYRRLGNAGLKVSALALGSFLNFGEILVDAGEKRKIVELAYAAGVNYFDLADEYTHGEAERQVGAILKQFPRHTLVLGSKVFYPMSDDVNDRGLSRKHIMESVHKSLQRLGTDYLDLYFCHRPDPETPIEETARAMHDLIQQGKVLYWGTSEWSAVQIAEIYAFCEQHNLHKPQVEQPQYSLVYRQNVEQNLLPVVTPRGIGLVVWAALAMGILTGKYDNGTPENARFATRLIARKAYYREEIIAKVRHLKMLADELQIERAQLALAWVLHQKQISSAIIGATTVAQLQSNLRAAEIMLATETLTAIHNILGDTEIPMSTFAGW